MEALEIGNRVVVVDDRGSSESYVGQILTIRAFEHDGASNSDGRYATFKETRMGLYEARLRKVTHERSETGRPLSIQQVRIWVADKKNSSLHFDGKAHIAVEDLLDYINNGPKTPTAADIVRARVEKSGPYKLGLTEEIIGDLKEAGFLL